MERRASDGANGPSGKKRKMDGGGGRDSDHSGIFLANGEQIRNPSRYVANMEQRGDTKTLYTADGDEIKNPVAFVAAMEKRASEGTSDPSRKRRKTDGGGGRDSGPSGMFLANGKRVKNPSAYVAKIEENGYTKTLYTADGNEIQNPVAFVAAMERRASDGANGPSGKKRKMDGGGGRDSGHSGIFLANGEQIRNPSGYVAKIKENGYTKPVYTAEGKEIKDPVAFLAAMERRAAGAGGDGRRKKMGSFAARTASNKRSRGEGKERGKGRIGSALVPVVKSGKMSYYGKKGTDGGKRRKPIGAAN